MKLRVLFVSIGVSGFLFSNAHNSVSAQSATPPKQTSNSAKTQKSFSKTKVVYKKKTTHIFSGDTIDGNNHKPMFKIYKSRQRRVFQSLIHYRKSYRIKLYQSAKNL